MDKKVYGAKHIISLIGIFILGETIITAPFKGADSLNVLALLTASVLAAAAAYLITPVISFGVVYNNGQNVVKQIISTLLLSVGIILSTFLAAKSFVVLCNI